MEKRGQVNILVTFLLVAIIIVAFLIVFNLVKFLVSEKAGGIESGFENYLEMLSGEPPVSEGLIAYYKFNGNANDETGNHNGTGGGVEFVNDPDRGQVVNFNSIGDNISVGTGWMPTGNMAISVWVYARSWGGENNGRIFVSKGGLKFYLDGQGDERLTLTSNNDVNFARSAQNMVLNQWKHLVVNRIGTNVYFYIDGVKSDAGEANGGTPLQGTSVFIGSTPSSDKTFDGYMDELMIFDRALTEQEISDIFTWEEPEQFTGIYVNHCQELTEANKVYGLNRSLLDSEVIDKCFNIKASNITLDCLGNSIGASMPGSAVYINSGYATIKNCDISIGGGNAITIYKAGNAHIYNNILYGNKYGVLIIPTHNQDALIEDNIINYNTECGICQKPDCRYLRSSDYLGSPDRPPASCSYSSSHNTVKDNEISYNGVGYYNFRSQGDSLINNVINNNVKDGMFLDYQVYNILIENNTIINNGGMGIYSDLLSGSVLAGNDVNFNRRDGLYAYKMSFTKLENNNFNFNSRYGIYYIAWDNNLSYNAAYGNVGDDFHCEPYGNPPYFSYSGKGFNSFGKINNCTDNWPGCCNLFSSNLPIVLIDSFGVEIPNEPKILANLTLLYKPNNKRNFLSDNFNYKGYIGIELRGQSSQWPNFLKKSYLFETRQWNGTGYADVDVGLMGFPYEEDWILKGDWFDRTLLRNSVAYNLSNEIGRYAVRTKPVEVFKKNYTTGNFEYDGISTFMENIKRGPDRVNIDKLEPTEISGDSVTGGYILSIDKGDCLIPLEVNDYFWTPNGTFSNGINYSGTRYLYKYPDSDEIVQEQKDYIKDYMTEFESVLAGPNFTDLVNGYAKYIDVDSFINYLILVEFTKNADALKTSTYFYKDKLGKINMGPIWDYDLAFGNMAYWGGPYEYGWQFQWMPGTGEREIPFWWKRLMQDPVFRQKFQNRWFELRADKLSLEHVFGIIDAKASEIEEAQQRHFGKWDTLNQENTRHTACGTVLLSWSSFPTGSNTDDGGFYSSVTLCPKFWRGEIQLMKEYLTARVNWVDNNIMKLNGWIAYNDLCNDDGTGSLGNVTNYGGSWPNSGYLKKYLDNTNTPAFLSFVNLTGALEEFKPINNANPAAGTDAYNEFGAIINSDGVTWSEVGVNFDIKISGLSSSKLYSVVVYGNRAGETSSYNSRFCNYTIKNVDNFISAGSIGTTKHTKYVANDTIDYLCGNNTATGYVAKWTDIKPKSNNISIEISGNNKRYVNAIKITELGLY